jgi:hypothetical protein
MPPTNASAPPSCQYCGVPLAISWLDLGRQPLANSYMPSAEEARSAPTYPLHARVCSSCWLVQVDRDVPPAEIFSDYAYFSSFSESWLDHCRRYSEAVIDRFGLGAESLVVEVASNDGYLLKNFVARGIPVLGIDPAANIGEVARQAGVPTETAFFGAALAENLVERGIRADHISAKNVLAHVPQIGDFAQGIATLLKPEAVFTVEFPHLLKTMQGLQFDQIYHEHFTYLSLLAVERIFADKGMRVFDVEALATHGGSLRVFICHRGAGHQETGRVAGVRDEELAAGLASAEGYAGYNDRVQRIAADFRELLETAREQGKLVAGYGAAAKGNTFLNFCGAEQSTLPFIADRSPAKFGKFMPGSAIPIVPPEHIQSARPDYLLILPWNLSKEIADQMAEIREWGGRFVTVIPAMRIF